MDTCQSGVLDASRAALRRELLTDDQVMSVVDENGNTDWSRLLNNAVLADNGISATELDDRVEAQLREGGGRERASTCVGDGHVRGVPS